MAVGFAVFGTNVKHLNILAPSVAELDNPVILYCKLANEYGCVFVILG